MLENKRWIREVMGNYMVNLAAKDDKLVAISADLFRSCRMEDFMEKYPNRTYNTGIAEQNMVGFAAGLAHEGFIPYAFSMSSFLTMRACEQCRTDVAYGNLNVRLMGVYAGLSGGLSGATHWSFEDCAIMTSMPNMTVLEPSDGFQIRRMMDKTLDWQGPIYMRVSVVPSFDIYDEDYTYEIGKASVPFDGDYGAIICSGVVVQYAVQAAKDILDETGLRIRVVDMHTIKPIDRDAIRSAALTGRILVAQDHNVIGGLGQQVATVLATENLNTKLEIVGVEDVFVPMARPEFLFHQFGYDREGLKKRMLGMVWN